MKPMLISKWLLGLTLALAIISLSSWENNYGQRIMSDQQSDTIKPKSKTTRNRDYRVEDMDKAMQELEKAQLQLDKTLKLDMERVNLDIKKAMEEMKKVDFDKIKAEIKASLANIDWDITHKEVDEAMRVAQKKIREVDMKKLSAELEKAKGDLANQKINIHGEIEKAMQEAREGMRTSLREMDKAKGKMARLKTFIDQLDKDGLIDKKGTYNIQIKNKRLFINGKEQSKEITDKYSKYLDDETDDFSIRKGRDGEEI